VTIPPSPEPGWAVDFHRQRPTGPHEPLRLRELSSYAKGRRIEGERLEPQPHDALWSTVFTREVAEFNAFIATFDITGCDPILFHRAFTHDLWHGGRWFASYSNRKPETRRGIRINGAAVTEVDIRASHLTILHGLADHPMPERADLYGDLGFPREVVKRWVTATLGAGKPVVRWSPQMLAEAHAKGTALPDYPAKAVGRAVLRPPTRSWQTRPSSADATNPGCHR
jgi:hypothetical protein